MMQNDNANKPRKNALNKSEAQLRFMAESMPQKIYTALPDGTVDYISPQWEEYAGVPTEELLGHGWAKILHRDEFQRIAKLWQHSMKNGLPFSTEYRLRRHDGEYRWHIAQARPMFDEKGNVIKWFGSSTDINDSKLSIEREHALAAQTLALTKEREKLLELNASKDEFISLASHQLRTPATIVKQYLNMILDGYAGKLTRKLEEMVTKANTSNDRQIEIVDDLLRVARLDAGKVKLVKRVESLLPLVQEVVNEHSTILEERNQKVTVTYNSSGITALIDRSRMKMVLENLLDNASKYSVDGRDIAIAINKNHYAVTIAVKDEGFGIAEEDLPKLFHKFSRLDNPLSVTVGGTGLGLYWAKRIVSLHGGTIEVKSTLGEGSTFTVVLAGKPVSL